MTPELKYKLKKVYALVKQGATEGERAAAEKALEKMLDKYNLTGVDLESLDKDWYYLTYTTDMEIWLLDRLFKTLLGEYPADAGRLPYRKKIGAKLTYLDWITISSAYEYFRRHMKAQWVKYCAPNLKRCRTTKSRNARRKELQEVFFSKYAIASNMYRPAELTTVELSKLSKKEAADRIRLSQQVEGGKYNVQVTNGLLLEK